MRFEPNIPNGNGFTELFDPPSNRHEMQLNFLHNNSDVVLDHAPGMAESILFCMEEDVIKSPKSPGLSCESVGSLSL